MTIYFIFPALRFFLSFTLRQAWHGMIFYKIEYKVARLAIFLSAQPIAFRIKKFVV